MKKNKAIYQLTVEDIQTVAIEELDRELTDDEIKKLIDPIAERISWYDAISDSIREAIGSIEIDEEDLPDL